MCGYRDLQQARDNEHAEQVASDYAVRAAVMDYKDLGRWKRALIEGTTPELAKKLTDAANAMEQIVLPLQVLHVETHRRKSPVTRQRCLRGRFLRQRHDQDGSGRG